MGVYIKGMEMPTSCARCRCAKGCPAVNDRIARMDEHPWFPCDHRHEDCPLVPVPPHGRLIDADVLCVEIDKICDRRDAGIITDLTCLQQILSAVRHAHVIIPASEEG